MFNQFVLIKHLRFKLQILQKLGFYMLNQPAKNAEIILRPVSFYQLSLLITSSKNRQVVVPKTFAELHSLCQTPNTSIQVAHYSGVNISAIYSVVEGAFSDKKFKDLGFVCTNQAVYYMAS